VKSQNSSSGASPLFWQTWDLQRAACYNIPHELAPSYFHRTEGISISQAGMKAGAVMFLL